MARASRPLECFRPLRRTPSGGGGGGGPSAPALQASRARRSQDEGPRSMRSFCSAGPMRWRRASSSKMSPSTSASPDTYALAAPSSPGAQSSRRSALGEEMTSRAGASSGPSRLPSQKRTPRGPPGPVRASTNGRASSAMLLSPTAPPPAPPMLGPRWGSAAAPLVGDHGEAGGDAQQALEGRALQQPDPLDVVQALEAR